MKTITLAEWREEGKKLFGDDPSKWAYVCPACKHVSTGQDFLDVGADINDSYVECIGRKNGKAVDGTKGKDEGYGCNWAAYGLSGTLNGGMCIETPDGKKVSVFDFHKPKEEDTK